MLRWIKQLKFNRSVNKVIKYILKYPPKGSKIKEYSFKNLTNDIFFCTKIKLESKDIGLINYEGDGIIKAYLISEYEALKERVRRAECWAKLDEIEAKYFKKYLDSLGYYYDLETCKRISQGYYGFNSHQTDLYREYMCTSFSREARDEYDAWEKSTENS